MIDYDQVSVCLDLIVFEATLFCYHHKIMSDIPSVEGPPPQEGSDQSSTPYVSSEMQQKYTEEEMDHFHRAVDAENSKIQEGVTTESMEAENEDDEEEWEEYSDSGESEDDDGTPDDAGIPEDAGMRVGDETMDGPSVSSAAGNEISAPEGLDEISAPQGLDEISAAEGEAIPEQNNQFQKSSEYNAENQQVLPSESQVDECANVRFSNEQALMSRSEAEEDKSSNVSDPNDPNVEAPNTEEDESLTAIREHGATVTDKTDVPQEIDSTGNEKDENSEQVEGALVSVPDTDSEAAAPIVNTESDTDPEAAAAPIVNTELKTELVEDENQDSNAKPPPPNQNPLDFVTVSFYQLKCKFCNASFDRRKTWKKHIASEHGIQPYCCQLCGEGFNHKSDLKEHISAHAKESPVRKSKPGALKESSKVDMSNIQQPTVHLSMMSQDRQERVATGGASTTRVPPHDEHKLQLTKSLKLLKVPRLRTSPDGSSASQSVKRDDRSDSMPNKRKRGQPRRLSNPSPVRARNKRKRSQPRKIKKGSPVKTLKIVFPNPNKKAKIKKEQTFEEEERPSPPKPDIVKGPYTLRGQGAEPNYKSQLDEFESKPSSSSSASHHPRRKVKVDLDATPFSCKFCEKEFETRAQKVRHEKIHKEFKCATCSQQFGNYRTLKKHEDNHYPDEMKCHCCNKLFKTKKDLYAHEDARGETCTCRWCNATFDTRIDLEMHERVHFITKGKDVLEKTVECAFCKKICKNRKSWKSHLVSHSNVRAFDCHICHKKYKQRGSFNLHMQRHNNTFYKFTCQFCGKKYGQKALLVIHERTHTNERPFQCGHCELSFPSKNQLDHHMERVNGVRHMCSFCGKQLNSRSSLEIHERKHTGERPIKCAHCEMDFVEPSAYKYHLRVIHTGERFECKFCGKKCKAKGVLTAHMRVHTGERPFKCKYCEKTFRSGNVLRTHLQGIHMGVRVKCDICDRAFAQSSAMNTHKKLVHQGLKWKDIQLQRKVNREEREKRDRNLILNAHVKLKRKDGDGDEDDDDDERGVPILSAIERSLLVPGMPPPAPIEEQRIRETSAKPEVDMMGASERSHHAEQTMIDTSSSSSSARNERERGIMAATARAQAERSMMEAEQMMEATARSMAAERNMMSSPPVGVAERNMLEASARSSAADHERNMSYAERHMMESSARGMMDASMRTSLNREMMEAHQERSMQERGMMDASARSVAEMNMMEASARSVLERGMMSASTARHIENERNMMEVAARSGVDRRMMPGGTRPMDEHERNMMAHSAGRPMVDKQTPVDMIFQPAVSGAAMYHVL